MGYKELINVIEDGSISVNHEELRGALLQITTDNDPVYANKFLDAICFYLSKSCGEMASDCSVYILDTLSWEADERYSYKGKGLGIQKFIRNSIKERVAPLN